MLLDIEVAARPGISIHQARRNLDAFQDAAAGFLHTSQRVDVLAFLAWLEAAAAEENGLDAAAPEVNHEAVQLLTVHASKGLEWDVVFVPGLNAGAFPSSRDSRWSSGSAALPWPLRGDRADLPQWDLDQPDQKGWLDAEKEFKSAVQAHGEAEERRLAYVAYTRAKHVLWVSSAAWVGSRAGLAEMSPFLAELEVPHGRRCGGRNPPALRQRGLAPGGQPADLGTGGGRVALRSPRRPHRPPHRRTAAARCRAPGRDGVRARPESWRPWHRDAPETALDAAAGAESAAPGPASAARSAGTLRGPAAGWAREAATLLERRLRRTACRTSTCPAISPRPPWWTWRTTPAPWSRGCGGRSRGNRACPRARAPPSTPGSRSTSVRPGMLDLGEAAGSDDHIDEAYGLDSMVETFRQSEWAHRAPAHVEVPVETRIGDVVVRGRIDAVFRDADGGWDLVDWKTGRRPSAGTAESEEPSSSPSTGWPGPGSRVFRWKKCGPRSTTWPTTRWSGRTTWDRRNGSRRSSRQPSGRASGALRLDHRQCGGRGVLGRRQRRRVALHRPRRRPPPDGHRGPVPLGGVRRRQRSVAGGILRRRPGCRRRRRPQPRAAGLDVRRRSAVTGVGGRPLTAGSVRASAAGSCRAARGQGCPRRTGASPSSVVLSTWRRLPADGTDRRRLGSPVAVSSSGGWA